MINETRSYNNSQFLMFACWSRISSTLEVPHQSSVFLGLQQPLYLFGQLIVHDGAMFVANQASPVGGLKDISRASVFFDGRAPMPSVGRDDQYGSSRTCCIRVVIFHCCFVGTGHTKSVAPLNHSCATIPRRLEIVQKIHAGEHKRRTNDAFRQRATVSGQEGWCIVCMPTCCLPFGSRIYSISVVVNQMCGEA